MQGFVCRAGAGEEVEVIQCLMTNVINSMRINTSYITRVLLVVPVCSFSHDRFILSKNLKQYFLACILGNSKE